MNQLSTGPVAALEDVTVVTELALSSLCIFLLTQLTADYGIYFFVNGFRMFIARNMSGPVAGNRRSGFS